jgi:hypothetical protein
MLVFHVAVLEGFEMPTTAFHVLVFFGKSRALELSRQGSREGCRSSKKESKFKIHLRILEMNVGVWSKREELPSLKRKMREHWFRGPCFPA